MSPSPNLYRYELWIVRGEIKMSRVSDAVKHIEDSIKNMRVLEVACGCADFSLEASKYASNVVCIDLDDFRLNQCILECQNVLFFQMDAKNLQFPDASFDTVVMYNAIFHLKEIIRPTLCECFRVLHTKGHIYYISSYKMDKRIIKEELIPHLVSSQIDYTFDEDKTFMYLSIAKTN